MNNTKGPRGLGTSFILILILLGAAIWISSLRSSETGYDWKNFQSDLEKGSIVRATVDPNSEVPTGKIIFVFKYS